MRLVCPTCDAEYEIARTAIPRSGREVECSNCGHGWFQAFADLTLDEALPDDGDAAPDATSPDLHRPVDSAVLDVLRQEADREAQARQAETERFGTEGQMPLAAVGDDAEPLYALRASNDAPPDLQPTRPRRDLLPAIDEVTAALQDGPIPDAPQLDGQFPPKSRPSAAMRVFLLLILAAVILLALYVFAPLIAEKAPALAQTSADYVAAVDRALLWAQVHMRQALEWAQSVWLRVTG